MSQTFRVDQRAQIDFPRLRKVIEDAGYTQTSLAMKMGVSPSALSRFLKQRYGDRNFALFPMVCKALGIPEKAFRLDWENDFDYIQEINRERVQKILADLVGGKTLLSFSLAFDSYLLPDPVAEAVKRKRLIQNGFQHEDLELRFSIFQAMERSRRKDREYRDHQMIVVGGVDQMVNVLQNNQESYEIERNLIRTYSEKTVPVLLTDDKARALHDRLCKYLNERSIGKINIRDDLLLVYWTRGNLFASYDKDRVRTVLGIIQTFLDERSNVGYTVPFNRDLQRSRLVRVASRDALVTLDTLVRKPTT